jgi:hypothetical protein
MKPRVTDDRRSETRQLAAAGNDWERVALARVRRHVAEIDLNPPLASQLGWESAALELIRGALKR